MASSIKAFMIIAAPACLQWTLALLSGDGVVSPAVTANDSSHRQTILILELLLFWNTAFVGVINEGS